MLLVGISGCVYVNDEGIGSRRYRDCTEYYDAEGIYHKKCDKNLIDYKDMRLKKSPSSPY